MKRKNNTTRILAILILITLSCIYEISCKIVDRKSIFDNVYDLLLNNENDRKIYINYINELYDSNLISEHGLKYENIDKDKEKKAAISNFNYYVKKYIINNKLAKQYFGKKIGLNDIEILDYEPIVTNGIYCVAGYDFLYKIEYDDEVHYLWIVNSLYDNKTVNNLEYSTISSTHSTTIFTDTTISNTVNETLKKSYKILEISQDIYSEDNKFVLDNIEVVCEKEENMRIVKNINCFFAVINKAFSKEVDYVYCRMKVED